MCKYFSVCSSETVITTSTFQNIVYQSMSSCVSVTDFFICSVWMWNVVSYYGVGEHRLQEYQEDIWT